MDNVKTIAENRSAASQREGLIATIGVDENGNDVSKDFSNINNILVSGTVGSGKTNFVRSVLLSLVEKYDNEQIGLIIYDSKKLDYQEYSGSSYMIIPIIHDSEKISAAIYWLVAEARERIETNKKEKHLFLILDDYEEISYDQNVAEGLKILLQLGRRTNIHAIVVTSTPSSNVVSGEIKSLLNCQVAFATVNATYSRMIIDDVGAERLEYPGGMIFKNHGDIVECKAVEYENYATLLRTAEKKNLLNIKNISNKATSIFTENQRNLFESIDNNEIGSTYGDELLMDAIELVIDSGKASVSMIQRRFRIGYNRAARIIDMMEDMGVVGPQDGSEPRRVLMTRAEFEDLKGDQQSDTLFDLNNKREVPSNNHYEVTMTAYGPNSDFLVEYKFNYRDVVDLIWHKKRFLQSAYLEVKLNKIPYCEKAPDLKITTGEYDWSTKGYSITIPNTKADEYKVKDFSYLLSSKTGITIKTV